MNTPMVETGELEREDDSLLLAKGRPNCKAGP